MAPTVGAVAALHADRVRVRRWQATGTDLETVVAKLHDIQYELSREDVTQPEHPHPRNCVLNLVVALDEKHRATECDRTVAGLAASHPLRAILVHLDPRGGPANGPGTLDAEITSEAHQLLSGFAVQREQVLLHARGEVARHLSSLVEPLLVPDIPTYLWWSGRHRLDEAIVQEALGFSDVLVVDSARFEHPADALLQLATLVADPDVSVGVADFRWDRVRPWRDAIAQFFSPRDRRVLLHGLQDVTIESAGTGPAARVGAALLAGWAAWALGSRFTRTSAAGEDATEAVAESDGHRVHLSLRSVANDHLHHGEVLSVRMAGRRGERTFVLTISRDPDGGHHADVVIELDGSDPVNQRLTLPRLGDPDLLVHILWGSQHDPVFRGALLTARPLLEAMR